MGGAWEAAGVRIELWNLYRHTLPQAIPDLLYFMSSLVAAERVGYIEEIVLCICGGFPKKVNGERRYS